MEPISSGTLAQRRNKTESLSIIVNRDVQKSLSERGTTEDLWWKCNFFINVLSFFRNSYSFRCFQSDGEFIPDPRRSDRESTFVHVKLEKCIENTISLPKYNTIYYIFLDCVISCMYIAG